MSDKQNRSIDGYISGFPADVQSISQELRRVIKKSAPGSQETISYGIPTFKLNGKNLVHFGAFKNHIGFFPTASAIPAFKKHLSPYKISKGTIRFPLDKPVPYKLVEKIVKFRVNEILSMDKG